MKKDFKFPTVIGLIVLIFGIIAGVYYSNSRTSFGTKASSGCNPDNVQITNVTHTSANISFVTSGTCRTTLDINNQVINDLKLEMVGTPDLATHIHYFEVKRLKEKSNYVFSIISNGNSYNNDNFKFTTASSPTSATPTSNLAWGKVFSEDGKTPGNAIVYLNIPGAYPLSSIVTTNGNWSISLASTFNESLTNWFSTTSADTTEEIIVISEDGVSTQVSNTVGRNNPVPNIIIGKNSLEVSQSNLPADNGQIQIQATTAPVKKVDILNPKDGDILSTNRPDFFGEAPINSRVIIEVHSPVAINSETVSDPSGTWHWSPPENLTPGEHEITVKSQNAITGVWETITRKFTVLAADSPSGPSFEASGSATTPTLIPTEVPTIMPTETPMPTVRVARPSTTVTPPVTGNYLPTISIVIFSCIFLLISYKLIL